MKIVGIIPAGGRANRMGQLPCSKEVFPLITSNGGLSVASSNLINYLSRAGVEEVYYVIRKGKWDIPEYFGNGASFNLNIAYLVIDKSFGTPFTVDEAFDFTSNCISVLGFPDIVVYPENAFLKLKEKFLLSDSDLILGMVPSKDYLNIDMIEFNTDGSIKDIIIKQNRPDLKYSWFGALWRPAFSGFMHNFLKEFIKMNPDGLLKGKDFPARELYIGDVVRYAIAANLKIDYLIFEDGRYSDLGTPSAIYNYISGGH